MKSSAFVIVLSLLLLALLKVSFQQSNGVCYQTVAVNTQEEQIRKMYYLTHLTFRCRWNLLEQCQGYGSKFRNVSFYVTKTVYQSRPYCCNGYIGNPPECKAFCSQRCYNGGTCTTPNNCTCQSGWTGHDCTLDINECENETLACGENQVCFNTYGSYLCECGLGYEDDGDLTCKDVDECSNNYHSCSHHCNNLPGGYNCYCNDGYYLLSNGNECQDINECLDSNANCGQICTNTNGSYHCSCNSEFTLSSDMHNCTDIKECSSNSHNCQQTCIELEGGFSCGCFDGFELENDSVSCKDRDECELGTSKCQQICINTIGSYNCDCQSGFQLNTTDNYTCIDINECLLENKVCEQNCINTYGSFRCSCNYGYTLDLDGVSCAGKPCLSLMNPRNGNYNCTGPPITGTVCSLSCNSGYRVNGPIERECRSNNLWSGVTSFCELLHCSVLDNPEHGSVILPCGTVLGTKCRISCLSGYYINSTNIIQECKLTGENAAEWTESPECIEADTCEPNPCEHDGVCTIGEDDSFVCNCEGTGYTGIDCNRLLIDVPKVPLISVNSPPTMLTLSARPDRKLVLELIQDDRIYFHVDPSSVTFSQNSTSHVISISASKPGKYKLRFEVLEKDIDIVNISPANILVIDSASNESNYFDRNEIESGLLIPGNCLQAANVSYTCKLNSCPLDIKCPNRNELFFNSTRKWSTKGSVNSQGILFSNNDGFVLPVAITGAKLTKPLEGERYIELDSLTTFESTSGCGTKQSGDACYDNCLSTNDIHSILHYESLAFTYLHQSKALIPKWLELKAIPSNRTSHNMHSYMVDLVYHDGFEIVQECNDLTALTNGLYSILIYTGSLHIQINNETRDLSSNTVPVCFATNLCEGTMSPLYITIPNNVRSELQSFQFMQDLKRKGWMTFINSLAIGDSPIDVEPHRNSSPISYWNGIQYFLPDPVTPNVVVAASFTKSFYVNNNFEVEWYFDGFVELFHKDFNKIFNAESRLGWSGNFSGSMHMNVSVNVNGAVSTIQLRNDTNSSLLLADDGDDSVECHGSCISPMGFSLKLVYYVDSTSSGRLSTLLFVPPKKEFGLTTQFSCPLDSYMFLDNNLNLEALSIVSPCLDIYLGMFPVFELETYIYIFDECKISPFCTALNSRDAKILLWSKFPDSLPYIDLGYFIKLLPRSDSNKTGLLATFSKDNDQFKAEFFNIQVSLFDEVFHCMATINEHHLEFSTEVKIFDRFLVQLKGEISQTSNWEGAPINIYGTFLNTSNNNFPQLLCKQVDNYIEILYNRSQIRVRNSELVYNRAKSQLVAAELNVNNADISKNQSYELVKKTEEEIKNVQQNISSLTNDSENANDEVKRLIESIDRLCSIKECPDICIPGQVCRECKQPAEALIQGTCTVECTVNVTVTEIVGFENMSRYEWVPTKVEPMFCYCSLFECTTSTPCVITALCKRVYFSSPITEDRNISQPSVCNKPCNETVVPVPIPTQCCINDPCLMRDTSAECIQNNSVCQTKRDTVYENLAEEQQNAIALLQVLDGARTNERMKRIQLMRHKARYNLAKRLFNESKTSLNQAKTALAIAENAFNEVKSENKLDLLEKIKGKSTCISTTSSYFKIQSVHFNATVVTESPTALPIDVEIYISSKNVSKSERIIVEFKPDRFDLSLQQAAVVIAGNVIFDERLSKRKTRNVINVNVSTADTNYLHFQSRCSDLENIISYFNKLDASIKTVATTAVSSMANLSENMQEISNLIELSLATFSRQINIDLEAIGNITNKDLGDLVISESNNTEETNELLSLMQEHQSESRELAKSVDGSIFQSWKAKMEDVHDQTKTAAGFSCFGFSDCLQMVLEELNELINNIPPQNAKDDLLKQFPDASKELLDLALLQDYSIILAINNTEKIHDIVNNPLLRDYWCAGPPIIVAQPVKRITPRETATIQLSCEVENEEYTTYQWRKDCIQLPNQKNRTLILTNVTFSDTGNYTCVVTNQATSVTSLNSSVDVQQLPSFFLELENVDEYYGNWNGAIFKTNASGWPYPGFRWYFRPKGETEFTQIPDEDENELAIVPPLPKDEGSYYCEAFNEQGFIRSRIVNLTVLDSSVVQVAQTVYFNFTSLNDPEESTIVDTNYNFEDNDNLGSGFDDISFASNAFKTNMVEILSTRIPLGSAYIDNITVFHNSSSGVTVSFTLYSQNISYPEIPLTEINQLAPQARVDWLPVWEGLQMLLTSSEFIVDDGITEYISNPSSVQFGILQFTCPVGKDVSAINNFLCDKTSLDVPPSKNQAPFNCPPGSYQIIEAERIVQNGRISRFTTQKCARCPVGYYQDEQGHAACKKCPIGYTTVATGVRLKYDCIKQCSPGSFSENGIEPCMPCPNGMYSTDTGSTSCFSCNDEEKRKLCPFADPCEKCQQLCYNNSGCACHDGYTLSSDGYSCIKCAKVFTNYNGVEGLTIVRPSWHVALCNSTDPSDPLVCSGSLINDRWLITSARCVCGDNIDINSLSLRINKLRTCVVEEDDEMSISASEIHCYPGFNNSDDKLTDLALIKMSSVIPKEKVNNTLPLCVNTDGANNFTFLYTYGLGNPTQIVTNRAILSPAFVSQSSGCLKEFLKEGIDYKNNPNVFCTGANSNGRCVGNPGSSVIGYDNTSGKITFLGVISRFTKTCGKAHSHIANTKIHRNDILEWIKNTIANN